MKRLAMKCFAEPNSERATTTYCPKPLDCRRMLDGDRLHVGRQYSGLQARHFRDESVGLQCAAISVRNGYARLADLDRIALAPRSQEALLEVQSLRVCDADGVFLSLVLRSRHFDDHRW